MATVTIKIGTPAPGQVKTAVQAALERAARKAVDLNRRNAFAGLGPDGNPRRPYTAAYAARHAAHTGSSKVDSVWAGLALGSLGVLAIDSSRGTFTYGAKDSDAARRLYYADKERPVIGIGTDKDKAAIARAFELEFGRQMKALNK